VTVYHVPGDDKAQQAQKLAGRGNVTLLAWEFAEAGADVTWEALPEGQEAVFYLLDGRADPVDQLELLSKWLPKQPVMLGRILTVVACALLHRHAELAGWFDACIHFSDVAILHQREGVPERFLREFQKQYEKACYPCLFVMTRKGRIANPGLVLEPQARRLSLVFDELEPLEDLELDEDRLPEEPFSLEGKVDPWFERYPNGARRRALADIREYLSGEARDGGEDT